MFGPTRSEARLTSPHRPILFRRSNADDRAKMDAVRQGPCPPALLDTIGSQLEELVKSRNPAATFTPPELQAAVRTVLGPTTVDQYGVWVYFPWLNCIVHTLDESEFIELRCDRNRNKITRDEQSRLRTVRVGVVGLSVGRVVASTLAQERACGQLRLADHDTLSLSNINRLRSGIHCIGESKAVLAAREISEIDPFFDVTIFPEGLSDNNLDDFLTADGKVDVLIDECDDLRMKFLLRRRARELRIPVLMDTSDRGLIDVERFDLEPDRPIFHGRVEDVDPETLRDLTTEEKVPTVFRILDGEQLSPRAIASLVEVGETISSWPQLASGVMLGGAVTADVVRRIALGSFTQSGRYRVDIEEIVADRAAPRPEQGLTETHMKAEAPDARPDPFLPPGITEATLHRLLEAATHAPTGGNNQPWLFRTNAEGVHVHHDAPRSTSFLDFGDGAAMMGLGAAVENFVLAAHREGIAVEVVPFPAPGDPRHVASIRMAATNDEARSHDALAAVIERRCTNRKLGRRGALTREQRDALHAAVEATGGAKLKLLEKEEELSEIGDILGRGDRVRFLSEELHREMMSEVRWTQEEAERTLDGIDVRTLELSASDLAGIKLCRSWTAMRLVRDVGGGAVLEKASRKAVAAASAVGLVTMPSARRRDFFDGGRAVERLWLQAEAFGIAVQPMSSLPYLFARLVRGEGEGMPKAQREGIRALRPAYARLFGVRDEEAEVLLVRFAFAPPVTVRALRRPVRDVWAR